MIIANRLFVSYLCSLDPEFWMYSVEDDGEAMAIAFHGNTNYMYLKIILANNFTIYALMGTNMFFKINITNKDKLS